MSKTMNKSSSPVPASGNDVRDIPLNQLVLDPENVRKTPADAAARTELVASIRSHGLLENLVVRSGDPDADGNPSFSVVAGGRRLEALMTIASEEGGDVAMPVSCKVVDAENSRELSLAENTVRLAMHPADQVEAFGKLLDDGINVASIASRFGVTERFVEQRLSLAGVLPEIIQAYRAGEIRMEVVKAFSITTDQERQKEVWKQVSAKRWAPEAYEVTRLLTDQRVSSQRRVAVFVGIDDYVAAGGSVMRDLFTADGEPVYWFEDPVLLNELATKKLDEIAEEQAKKWKWAQPMLELEWNTLHGYGKIEPQPGQPTEKEKKDLEKIRARMDELEAIPGDEWTDRLEKEAARLEERVDTIQERIEKRAKFRKEDCTKSGCIVTIDRDGEPGVIGGLVRPEDMPKPKAGKGKGAKGAETAADGDDSAGGYIAPPLASRSAGKDPRTQARADAGLTAALAEDLQAIRTTTVKHHLAQNFDAAFDLVLFQAAISIFGHAYSSRGSLDFSCKRTSCRPMTRMNDEDFPAWNPAEEKLEDCSEVPLGWMEDEEDDAARFAALRELPREDKERLFAATFARSLKGQLALEYGARPEFEATVARLDIDFAQETRPSAGLYWSRISKGKMLSIASDTLGDKWSSARTGLKKGVLVESMEQAFTAGDTPSDLSAEEHARAMAWTMPGFRAYDGTDGGEESSASEPAAPATQEHPDAELPEFLDEAG